jgi:hypothetical protein
VARLDKLLEEGFFKENKIDTFFLFGGTNDSWAEAPLGEEILADWKKEDLYNVFPAFSYLINTIVHNFADAKIYCILNTGLRDEISKFYTRICHEKGVDLIVLHDIDKIHGHPTVDGMKKIKEQVLEYIEKGE